MTKRALVVGIGLLMASWMPLLANAGTDPANKCTASKSTATGKQLGAFLKALGKNAKNPDVGRLDSSISKARSKYTKSFTKAESTGECLTENDSSSIEALVDQAAADVALIVDGACEGTCGNNTVEAFCNEECDDGNTSPGDDCDGKCRIEDAATGFGTATTDNEMDGVAESDDTVETTVTSPDSLAPISIRETSTTSTPPTGFALLDTQVEITAPPATVENPLRIVFLLDTSLDGILANIQLELIAVFKDGALIGPCVDGPDATRAVPDTCIANRVLVGTSDAQITILTTTASTWTFGGPINCCTFNPSTMDFVLGGTGTCGVLKGFVCTNANQLACVTDGDCDFGTCSTLLGKCNDNLSVSCTVDADCSGMCGESTGPGAMLPLDLDCGAFYFGGGFNALTLPGVLAGSIDSVMNVTSCNDTTGDISLSFSTAAETGTDRTCTEGRKCSVSDTTCVLDSDCPSSETCDRNCFFGAPTPLPNTATPAVSSCLVWEFGEDATGSAACNGAVDLGLNLRVRTYLTGDLEPTISGVQACPACVRQCADGTPCTDDSDCAGVCSVGEKCLGGANDGAACTPESGDLGDNFQTSQDCQPDPISELTVSTGGFRSDLLLTTNQVTVNAVNQPQQPRSFCGFCRDYYGVGSLCFEGDPSGFGCPSGGSTQVVPCDSDADCDDGDEYESCTQRNPGAFGRSTATQINLAGAPVPPGTPGEEATLVSPGCIAPSFDATVDAAADLPGPTVVTFKATATLNP